ncbi:hypothetical protein Pmani_013015 [Petrolisthes manimaculis]|uniref:Uncharacterized protein n=1 Tax=Petrolisthes manimaculis TaxID=1843537 RepID=A0AAE1PZQ9_9EUCA|nr:hypothetical protein Pmani_013015 [Petrolisthes manimaculis]
MSEIFPWIWEAVCNWPRCLVLVPHWSESNRSEAGQPISVGSPPGAWLVALLSFRIIQDAYCLVMPGSITLANWNSP